MKEKSAAEIHAKYSFSSSTPAKVMNYVDGRNSSMCFLVPIIFTCKQYKQKGVQKNCFTFSFIID